MFGLFKRKSPIEKLGEQYASLMAECHRLAGVNRALSDQKFAEAEKVAAEIEALKKP